MDKLDLQLLELKKRPWVGGTILVAGLVAVGIVGSEWLTLRGQLRDGREQVSRLEMTLVERNRTEAQATATPQQEQREVAQRQIQRNLDYDWDRVFATLERASGEGVAVLAFSHDQAAGRPQIVVEVTAVPALAGLITRVNDSESEGRWYVASYQPQTQSVPATVRAIVTSR